MRHRLSRLGLALAAVGTAMLAQPIHADAASVTKVGWWYRTSDPASVLPRAASSSLVPDLGLPAVAPPTGPGHLHVEGTPSGATAIAAIAYVLHDRESSPVLTIRPEDNSYTPSDLLILACRAAVDWTRPVTTPGRWQDKPLVDCNRSVNGIVNMDGTITFPLQPLVGGPELNVVLVPGVVADTPVGKIGSTFSLSFGATSGARLTTSHAPADDSPPKERSEVERTQLRRSSAPAVSAGVASVAPAAEPALELQEQVRTASALPPASPPPPVPDRETGRRVAVGILLVGAAAAALAQINTRRTGGKIAGLLARTEGARGDERDGVTAGLGRFARPRTGAPASLR